MEEYYCEICDKHITIKSKSKHLKSKSHIDKSECDHIILPLNNMDIDEADELYNLYLIKHSKKRDF